jgi:hypothetical protein
MFKEEYIGLSLHSELVNRAEQNSKVNHTTMKLVRLFRNSVGEYAQDSRIQEATQLLLVFISQDGTLVTPQQHHFSKCLYFSWEGLGNDIDFDSVVNHILAHAIQELQLLEFEAGNDSLR